MIKVTGQNEAFIKKCSCSNCASNLEYTQEERKYHYGYEQYYIICPKCKNRIYVS